jgi:hypothetical protein
MDLENLTIGQLKKALESKTEEKTTDIFIVRTSSAGVFYGEILRREGMEVTMKNARRIWYWSGAASLSQLATEGTSAPNSCKFPMPVSSVLLTQAIEIIPMTERAVKSLNGVSVWKQ